MAKPSQSATCRLSIACGCLLVGLAIGACGGDDDSPASGSGGESGTTSSGGSAGGGVSAEPSGGADENVSVGGTEAGSDASAAGQSVGGSASAGATTGGVSGGGISSGGSAGSGLYLPCASQADCKQFGGGKVCCAVPGMQFCTKPSACSGKTLP